MERTENSNVNTDHVNTYHGILDQAESADRRGDVVIRDQRLRDADEYAWTRMTSAERKMAGIA